LSIFLYRSSFLGFVNFYHWLFYKFFFCFFIAPFNLEFLFSNLVLVFFSSFFPCLFFFFVKFQLFSILFFNQYFLFVSFLDLILILFVVCFMEFIFLFQFSPSIQNYIPFQLFSFKFYHHSLNFYFFF
jgi:hypothetical protein